MTAAGVPKAIIKDNASYTLMLSPPVGGTDLSEGPGTQEESRDGKFRFSPCGASLFCI